MAEESGKRGTIGLVVPAFDRGGLEQVVLNLYRGFRRAGYDCLILIENNEAGYMSSLVRPGDAFIFNRDERLFLNKCHERRVGALSYHYSTFGLQDCSRLGFYTLYTLHNVYTWLDDDQFAARARQILAADGVIAVSSFVRNYFCRRAGAPRDAVEIIGNGVDVAGLKRPVRPLTDYAFGSSGNKTVFGVLASFHRNKHHLLAVRAAEILAARRQDFEVLFVGNAAVPDYHAEIRRAVAASGARERIHFTGFLDHEQMAALYQHTLDAVLLASLQEGCSNVVLEALAFDLPMVLTDVGNAQEAAALSSKVRVVPRSYPDLMALRPAEIDRLSRTGDTPNVEALADAMEAIIESRETLRNPNPPADRIISVDAMVGQYLRAIEAAPLLDILAKASAL